ncbi:MAG: FecR domain-containing protein [Caulobacteraceae bacterium]|nr:FecR domain-containing protein [Caulobacteraceae bacterium]
MTEDRPKRGEEREEQAVAWLVRLNSGEAGADDWRALEDWLAADPANLAAYERVEMLWADLGDEAEDLRRSLDAADPGPTVVPLVRPQRPAPRAPALRWAAAAALAIVAGGAGLFAYVHGRPTDYRTAPGQIQHIALADGSRIDLNGASRLAVGFDRAARRVKMDDAEASFDVTKDPSRPFLISAGAQRIRVVGTAFDVIHHGGELVVTVRRGVVEVARSGEGGQVSDVARVPAGFQLVRRAGEAGTVIRAVDPDEAFAWREGRLIYHDRSLAAVVGDLNRAFPVPIEVQGPARDLRFSGVLVLDDETAVIRRLQAFLPVDAHRSQDEIVLNSRP